MQKCCKTVKHQVLKFACNSLKLKRSMCINNKFGSRVQTINFIDFLRAANKR